jgi:hypothetical protein
MTYMFFFGFGWGMIFAMGVLLVLDALFGIFRSDR